MLRSFADTVVRGYKSHLILKDQWTRLQKLLPQRVVRIECDSVHLTLVSRFAYDWMYFGAEVAALRESLDTSALCSASANTDTVATPAYRTISEVLHPYHCSEASLKGRTT